MSKEQMSRVLGVILSAVLALLAVFGYDVVVIQPREVGQAGGVPVVVQDVGSGGGQLNCVCVPAP